MVPQCGVSPHSGFDLPYSRGITIPIMCSVEPDAMILHQSCGQRAMLFHTQHGSTCALQGSKTPRAVARTQVCGAPPLHHLAAGRQGARLSQAPRPQAAAAWCPGADDAAAHTHGGRRTALLRSSRARRRRRGGDGCPLQLAGGDVKQGGDRAVRQVARVRQRVAWAAACEGGWWVGW